MPQTASYKLLSALIARKRNEGNLYGNPEELIVSKRLKHGINGSGMVVPNYLVIRNIFQRFVHFFLTGTIAYTLGGHLGIFRILLK